MVLDKIMTFSEAAEEWGLDTSTLRKLVKTNKVTEGKDFKRSGNVWIITRKAMLKVYGEPKSK